MSTYKRLLVVFISMLLALIIVVLLRLMLILYVDMASAESALTADQLRSLSFITGADEIGSVIVHFNGGQRQEDGGLVLSKAYPILQEKDAINIVNSLLPIYSVNYVSDAGFPDSEEFQIRLLSKQGSFEIAVIVFGDELVYHIGDYLYRGGDAEQFLESICSIQ